MMNKKEEIIKLALWRNTIEQLNEKQIKRLKKVNFSEREVYFLEAKLSYKIWRKTSSDRKYREFPVRVKYTLTANKNSWTIISISKGNGPLHPSGKWERDILSHLFPKEVGKLSVDEAELLLRFLKLREAFESLISKYGK